MVDYKKIENDEDFMDILNYLRCESLADKWEVSETLDIDIEDENSKISLDWTYIEKWLKSTTSSIQTLLRLICW